MISSEKHIQNFIRSQIEMGFYSMEEIKDNVIEEIYDRGLKGKISTEWAIGRVDWILKEFIKESKHWNRPTDTDKLISAFDDLCEQGIIALHNAGYTIKDGESEILDIEAILIAERGVSSNGYCFYSENDLQNALESEELHITFQKLGKHDTATVVSVGKIISSTLEKHGLSVEWTGKAKDKILVKNFKWQFPYIPERRDLWEYDDVIDLILGNYR